VKRASGIALLVLLAPLALWVLTGPPSPSAACYVLAPILGASALVVRSRVWARRLGAGAGLLFVGTVVVRIAHTPSMGDTRILCRLVDERDPSVDAARALRWTHLVPDPDVPRLGDAMRDAYGEMSASFGNIPSPLVPTVLGLQRRGASDTIEFERPGAKHAVVFLHGYAGNYAMSCWLFARAALAAGLTTVCPSTRFVGDWWTADGEGTVRDTVASLRARGYDRIVLAGLSNGGIGASRLITRMPSTFAALVVVSGAASDADAPNVPTLVVQGKNDHQIPASIVRGYAARASATYLEYDAGHFVLLVERDRVAPAITTWLTSVPW
jgi:pimeloyl-ACP methyl ester carboxylesterase